MTTKNDGGAAFPVPLNPGESYNQHGPADGMTLRDYFAAKALQAIVSYEVLWEQSDSAIAKFAYGLADAMLEQRENKS